MKKTLKKVLCFALAGATVLSLVACNGNRGPLAADELSYDVSKHDQKSAEVYAPKL